MISLCVKERLDVLLFKYESIVNINKASNNFTV